jgi:hypothetical protein
MPCIETSDVIIVEMATQPLASAYTQRFYAFFRGYPLYTIILPY